jgi:hypothetical protein
MEATAQLEMFPLTEQRVRRKGFLREVLEAFDQHKVLMPPAWVAHALALSHQRVSQLIDQGRLATVEVRGRKLVPIASIEAWIADERKNGRPFKEPSLKEAYSEGFRNLKKS